MTQARVQTHSRADTEAYLQKLGERVRTWRSQRGMTRKELARQARVSERYLAQLEAGLGNGSIVLLRRIARSMGMPVTQLVHDGAAPSLDLVLLSQFLERLPPAALSEARDLLHQRFGSPSGDQHNRRIALIGLRGGGKSTLGRLLAEQIDIPFIELDREIERRSGTTLSQIFDMFGQETFRRAEREALDEVLRAHPQFVMATSGSIVSDPATLELLLSSCLTVWVHATPHEHMQRVIDQGDMRPMAKSGRAMEDLLGILRSREQLYARAELNLSTTGKTPDQSLAELLRALPDPAKRFASQDRMTPATAGAPPSRENVQ